MIRSGVRRVVAASAVVLLTACGGGGTSSPKAPANEAGLQGAVKGFNDALFSGDTGDAYAYFTKECRSEVSKNEFGALAQLGLAFLAGFSDFDPSELRTGDVEVQNLTASIAEARYEILDPNGDVFSSLDEQAWAEWVYEEGGWRTPDCSDFSGEGGDIDLDLSSDGSFDAFSYPACSELVDGQPLPEEFGSGSEIDISCEDGETTNFGFTTTCFTSTREYAENDLGYVFLDEGVFYEGDVKGCAPQCSDLVDGQPVPADFDDESAAGFNLNCESPTGEENWSFEWECFDSDRMYVENDDGYAFVDDRIYVAGDPEYC
jgi:hypothetical protein